MFARILFSVYKQLLSFSLYRGFRSHEVYPLEPPDEERIDIIPFSQAHPLVRVEGLYSTRNFPAQDHPEERLAIVESNQKLVRLAGLLKRPGLPPVPRDDDEYVKSVYPYFLRKAWPHPPSLPAELRNEQDLTGALALKGPLAENVRNITTGEIDRLSKGGASPADESCFVIDTEELADYAVKPGLLPLGSLAVLQYDREAGRMRTRYIQYREKTVTPASPEWNEAQKVTLCGLLTRQNIIRHNLYLHLLLSTDFTAISINRLGAAHPIRRLLHVCCKTVLVGNEELARMHVRDEEGFFTKLFSFTHPVLVQYISDSLEAFDLRRLDPSYDREARQMTDPEIRYPMMDNLLPLWESIRTFVDRYVDRYYPDDTVALNDGDLQGWFAELNEKIPNGVERYAPRPDREGVKKLCALFIFASTVDHDLQNNVLWDYAPLSQHIPTIVPADGSLPPVDVALQFLATILVTWKPFNMLLDDFSSLAPDETGAGIIRDFLDDLRGLQQQIDGLPHDPSLVQPKNLNYSVSQ